MDHMYQWGEHCRRLERILYVFARLNRGLGYMQGFHELIVPFYYILQAAQNVLNNDPDLVESLAFECLTHLLNESTLNEFYTTADSSSIIMHRLDAFDALLASHIPEVAQITKELGIRPLIYAFRWCNLLFSQEHELPTLLTVWDSLLAHFDNADPPGLMTFVFYVGLGHMNAIRVKFVGNNYAETVRNLQNMGPVDIKEVLRFANACWGKDHPDERELVKKKKRKRFLA
jgi:hypothetical protein